MKLSAAVEDYEKCFWREANHSKATRYVYWGRLKHLARWCDSQGMGDPSIQDLDASVLRRYYSAIRDTEVNPKTVRSHIHSIRFLFGFLTADGVLTEDHSRQYRLPRVIPGERTIVSEEDLYRLLDACDKQISELRRVRDRALIAVLIFCCLRRQECLDLELSHISLEDRTLRVRCGKGGKDRELPLCPEVLEPLTAWMAIRRDKKVTNGHQKLFTTLDGRPLGENGLPIILQQACRIAGLPFEGAAKITAHCLRHAGATRWYRMTKDLVSIKALLGHSEIKTTLVYLRAQEQDIRYLANLTSSRGLPASQTQTQNKQEVTGEPATRERTQERSTFFQARRRAIR
jgi:site-specific recombinase XerD